MRTHRTAPCAILLLLAAHAFASAPTPGDEPDSRDLMSLLKDHMAGQRIIAVGVGDIEHGVHFDEAAFDRAEDDLGRLQAIASAVSGERETYIPFLVGNAWVIAPETRAEVRVDLSRVADIDAQGGRLLLDQIILSLAPDLLAAAGSDDGIPATRLSPDAQAMLSRILKPPFRITQSRDGTWTDLTGRQREGFQYDRLGSITEPLDLSNVRLRARLWIEAADVQVDRSYQRLGRQRRHERPGVSLGGWRNVEAPVEVVAANRFKPSDLDGKAWTQPFGADGVMRVSDALRRVEGATALTLHPGAYGGAPVFVGSPDLTCGEVLDGLRLAITGAWRKVGDGYVLCWDRRGLAALNQTLTETSVDLVDRMNRVAESLEYDPRWLHIAERMPFAPDDPLALTDAQREQCFRKPDMTMVDGIPTEGRSGVPYSDLTPDQQSYLEECARVDQMTIYPPNGFDSPDLSDRPDPEHRPFTPDDVRAARLGEVSTPEVSVEFHLPGFGWVRNGPNYPWRLSPDRLEEIRVRMAQEKARAEREAQRGPARTRPEPPPGTYTPKPFTIAAPDRGVMVGPMRAESLNALARKMKSGRFTTLYYPVLHDGYATLPSKAFPAHPDLKGENGMAAALAAAKANGLKVIGYLSPIAWRSHRQAAHWLDRRPDWLDRDPLGRTRLEWLKDRDTRKQPLPSDQSEITWRDFVRPTEPEVIRRLETLVGEFAATEAGGLMLLEWQRRDIEDHGRTLSPPLGFALKDRLTALEVTGYDPLDASLDTIYDDSVALSPPDPRPLGRDGYRFVGIGNRGFSGLYDPPVVDAHVALADRLLAHARTLRGDWTTGIVDPGLSDPHRHEWPEPPAHAWKVDLILSEFGPEGARDGRIVADLPWDESEDAEWIPKEVRPHSGLLFLDWSAEGLSRGAKTIVLDFRFRSTHIDAVLNLVR